MTRHEYEQYLKTEHWTAFSLDVKHKRPSCERCGITREDSKRLWRQDLNVHHKTYERIGRERPEDVQVLCWKCHMGSHGPSGKLLSALGELFMSKRMEDVDPSAQIYCWNCGRRYPKLVYADEVFEWLCLECKAA